MATILPRPLGSTIWLTLLILITTELRALSAPSFTQEPITLPIPVGTLAGTLLLPSGPGPFPVALIIAGSGPTDRDGNSMVLKTDTYKKLAQGLAEQGIATLRYDKRSIGASLARQAESDLRFDDYVNDALALTALLERDERFTSVSIIGHSEGSLLGMLAARRDPNVRAFVSLAGAGRNLATILDEQIRANPNNPPNILKEVESINASLLAGKTVANTDPLLAALFRPSVQPYVISEYKYDPAKEIAKLTIPVLIVQGTSDVQVGIADAKRLATAKPDATFVLIDGMNHILVDAPADRSQNIATYSDPSLPLNTKLIPTIAAFLKTQTHGTAASL
ncbi:MAG: alpha/beta fold hydrolase [Candidatus Eremiobacteraeota bacterium]|nr:alpha/beta fold hydrolase [Candidatus Eremiobacteraeota bacterium]